jgi:hypothetical protein
MGETIFWRNKLFETTYDINLDDNGKISGITIEDANNELSGIDIDVSEDDFVDEFLSSDK